MGRKPHDPGRMRTFARLEAATLTPDGAGGHAETWIALANVPIEIEPVSARSDFSADQLRETATHRAIFRRRSDVASGSGLDDFAEGWFANGLLQVGAAPPVRIAGHRRSASAVLLDPALAFAVAPGATFMATAGCDKRFATCRTRFANTLNFRGFPHLPGNDAAYGYATEDAVFDGAPLVP